MIVTMDAAYVKGDARVNLGEYDNGRTAIMLNDPDTGEPLAKATVNLPEAQLEAGQVFLKGWSENEGIPQSLEKAGVVKLTGKVVSVGFVTAQVAELMPEFRK